jgi:hypothetical protein
VPRGLVVLFALLEALFVVGLGIFLPFIFGVVGWASLTGVNSTPVAIWQLAVQAWALGHGVPLHVSLGDSSSVLVNDMATFDLTLAPFAFALVTALLGRRAGRRLAGSNDATLVVGLLVFFTGSLALLALLSGQSSLVQLDVASGTVRVLAPFVVGLVIGWRPWEDDRSLRARIPGIPIAWRDVIDIAQRIAGATLAGLVVIASFGLLALLCVGFSTEIALYESLHTGILGGLVITVAQIAFIPVALVWTISWVAGPGFTLGTGAIVSPFVTTVGAVPAIPLLGAMPVFQSRQHHRSWSCCRHGCARGGRNRAGNGLGRFVRNRLGRTGTIRSPRNQSPHHRFGPRRWGLCRIARGTLPRKNCSRFEGNAGRLVRNP